MTLEEPSERASAVPKLLFHYRRWAQGKCIIVALQKRWLNARTTDEANGYEDLQDLAQHLYTEKTSWYWSFDPDLIDI